MTLPNKIAHKLKNLKNKLPKNNPGPRCKGVKGIIKIQNSNLKIQKISSNHRITEKSKKTSTSISYISNIRCVSKNYILCLRKIKAMAMVLRQLAIVYYFTC